MITLVAGNSRILLTVDERGNWSNLYYPFAGQYQHLREIRLGLYSVEDGKFVWMGDDSPPAKGKPATWTIEQGYVGRSNTPRTTYHSAQLDVEVTDTVHSNHDLIIRRIVLRNKTDARRKYRVFTYQSLTIAESMYQDTSYWDDARRTLNHYKRNYYFQLWGIPDFSAFTCGEHTLKGLQGSYVDAEDGKLEGGRISHGAADSVGQWDLDVPPGGEANATCYWMLGHSRLDVNNFYGYLKQREPLDFMQEATAYWTNWLQQKRVTHQPGFSAKVHDVYLRSIFMLRNCSSTNGSIVASPDPRTLKSGGDTYNYNWWRDGGYIAKAMDEVGLYENAHRFLQFALDCQESEGYFLHRHFPDGTVGSTWHPPPFLQVDQTATVVAATWHHFKRHGDLDQLLDLWPMVKKAANFLESFTDERGLPLPSYDLWEERKAVHTYSAAAVIHGLERAERISEQLGKARGRWRKASERMRNATLDALWDDARGCFLKSVDPIDKTIDASTLLAIKLGVIDPKSKHAERLVNVIEHRLWSPKVGGLARYENDQYYGTENPWIICTLWLAEAHLMMGHSERTKELIEWTASKASSTGLLPEQLDAVTGEHTSVTPLTWSHSTFLDVLNKYRRVEAGISDDRAE
ncbi:MAG: glycoside hydrolase family 15 protein [Thermoplasmatota archaeon]